MTFNERVITQMALSAKRREYFGNWLTSHSVQGDIAYWAQCIEQVNDAAEAVAKMGGK